MEFLRYFVYGKKWKKKLINKFNSIFSKDKYFKTIAMNNDLIYKLPFLCSYNKIETYINKIQLFLHDKDSDRRIDTFPDYQHILMAFNSYSYGKDLKTVNNIINVSNSKLIILRSTAGNGKTNLLCNITDLLLKLDKRVIFINAKDIDCSLDEYINKRINMYSILKNKPWLCNLFFRFFKTFLVIDAINENDNPEFAKQLFEFIENFSTSRIKILISARQELFEQRYGSFIERLSLEPYFLDIDNQYITNRIQDNIIERYSREFSVTINNNFQKQKLFDSSLLFLRIFFEVNENKIVNDISLYHYKLYINYLAKLKSKYTSFETETEKIIDLLSEYMINNHKFDYVPMDFILQTINNKKLIISLCDDNMLTCRKEILNQNSIAETSLEVIYFPFDELRDFCLARYLVYQYITDQDHNDKDKELLITNFLDSLSKNHNSPLEGILHYLYLHFKDNNNETICKMLLEKYMSKLFNHPQNENHFKNIGFTIIFDSEKPILPFEKNYIKLMLEACKGYDFPQLINFCFYHEFFSDTITTQFILDILYEYDNYQNILSLFSTYINNTYYARQYWEYEHILPLLKLLYIAIEKSSCNGYIELLVFMSIILDDFYSIRSILERHNLYNVFLQKIHTNTKCEEIKKLISMNYNTEEDILKQSDLLDFIRGEINEIEFD